MTPNEYTEALYLAFDHYRSDYAIAMKQYMRNQFEFFGIRSPQRKTIQKDFLKQNPINSLEAAIEIINLCWEYDEREMHHAGIFFLSKISKQLTAKHSSFLVHLICTKSWWDTVDDLASNAIGNVFLRKSPELIPTLTDQWILSENMWLRRTAIIFQLKYKDQTDFERLKRFILTTKSEKAFFIQKANGWALRQYSKFNPKDVALFIQSETLANLTQKEGLKWISKNQPNLLSK